MKDVIPPWKSAAKFVSIHRVQTDLNTFTNTFYRIWLPQFTVIVKIYLLVNRTYMFTPTQKITNNI